MNHINWLGVLWGIFKMGMIGAAISLIPTVYSIIVFNVKRIREEKKGAE